MTGIRDRSDSSVGSQNRFSSQGNSSSSAVRGDVDLGYSRVETAVTFRIIGFVSMQIPSDDRLADNINPAEPLSDQTNTIASMQSRTTGFPNLRHPQPFDDVSVSSEPGSWRDNDDLFFDNDSLGLNAARLGLQRVTNPVPREIEMVEPLCFDRLPLVKITDEFLLQYEEKVYFVESMGGSPRLSDMKENNNGFDELIVADGYVLSFAEMVRSGNDRIALELPTMVDTHRPDGVIVQPLTNRWIDLRGEREHQQGEPHIIKAQRIDINELRQMLSNRQIDPPIPITDSYL